MCHYSFNPATGVHSFKGCFDGDKHASETELKQPAQVDGDEHDAPTEVPSFLSWLAR